MPLPLLVMTGRMAKERRRRRGGEQTSKSTTSCRCGACVPSASALCALAPRSQPPALLLQTHLRVVHLGGPLLLLSLVKGLLTWLIPRLNRHLHWHGLVGCARVLLVLAAAHAAISLVAGELALIVLVAVLELILVAAAIRVHLLLLQLGLTVSE